MSLIWCVSATMNTLSELEYQPEIFNIKNIAKKIVTGTNALKNNQNIKSCFSNFSNYKAWFSMPGGDGENLFYR